MSLVLYQLQMHTALLKKITHQKELNGDTGAKAKHSAELTHHHRFVISLYS